MSTLFLPPIPFTVLAQSGGVTPTSYLLNDEKGLVWRTANLTGNYITAQLDGSVIDTVAIVGSNLIAGNTVRFRLGNTQAAVEGSSAAIDVTIGLAAGTADTNQALLFHKLTTPAAHGFLRIDFTAASNPDTFLEFSRLVVGKSVICDGVSAGVEFGYDNQTVSSLDREATKPMWKFTVSGFTEATYWSLWHPLLKVLGDKRGFLFIPDLQSDYLQQQALFCYVTSTSKGSATNSDYYMIDIQVQSLL